MKKFGTPIFAGPGTASAKLGFERAGLPSPFVSFGVGTAAGATGRRGGRRTLKVGSRANRTCRPDRRG